MLSKLFIMDALDDGSRILGVGVNYDVAMTQDSSTGAVYVGDGPGSTNAIYQFTSDFALTASVEGNIPGTYAVSFDGLAVNGSNLLAAGFQYDGLSYTPGAFSWVKSPIAYTNGRVTDVLLGSTSASRFRAASVNASTGAYVAGDHNTDQMLVGSVASGGTFNWLQRFIEVAGYLSAASIYGVALNPNNSNVTVGGTITRASDGDVRGIVAAFNSSGTLQWGFELYGTGSNRVAGLCCDSSGNSYIAVGGSGGAVPVIVKMDSSGSVTASLNLDTTQVTNLHGIYLQGTTLIVAGTHASGGLAIILTDTSLSTPTGTRLYDTAGAMSYPRNVHFGYYGGFYYFNFAANGGNLCIAKISPAVLAATIATFGNRFQLAAFTPTSAAYTLSTASTGANYTTASTTTDVDNISGSAAISSPSLTDYFMS